MSKVSNLPQLVSPDNADLLYIVDVSEGTSGSRKIIISDLKTAVSLTDAEVKTKYENNADTNAFTDAEQAKLAGIEAGATADQLASEVPYTNTGTNISASDVQAAITELDTRTLPLYVKVIAGLVASYNAGIVRFQDTVYQVTSGSIALNPSVTAGTLYVDTDGTVKQTGSGVNPPSRAVPMALFTTSGSTITSLTDIRCSINNTTIAGLTADLASIGADNVATPGTTQRYADAAHVHSVVTSAPVATGSANSIGTGNALARASHVHDTVLTSQTVSDTADASTTSLTDVLLTSMSITVAVAGKYDVRFSTSTVNSGNGAERNYFSVYANSVQIAESERKVGISGGAYCDVSTQAITPVLSVGQTIEIRWRVIAGTGTASRRTLTAVRLGPS